MNDSLASARDTREKGATAVEYSLLAALVAGVIVAVVATLGENVLVLFHSALDIWP